jgi:hypothetical protein
MLRIDCSAGVCDEFTWIPTIQTYKNYDGLGLTLLCFLWYLEFYCSIINPHDT